MSEEPFDWNDGKARWSTITNDYGKLLTYNLPRYNKSYATCKYQKSIVDMIESHKYDTFIDCGAFVGLFSQIAAHYCEQVIAYEAHPFYFGVLLFNMRFFKNVSCRYKFLSHPLGVPRMDLDVKGLIPLKGKKCYNIPTASLDEESGSGIHFSTLIKLDVEGHEIDVLIGSKRLLQKPNIHWHIDVHNQYGIDIKEVLSYFPDRKITMISPKVIKVEGIA